MHNINKFLPKIITPSVQRNQTMCLFTTQKQKMSEIDEDFYRQQLESAETDKSLIDMITKVVESVYKEFLSYFV